MAAVPSTSGTGGVLGLSSDDAPSYRPQPFRSRSSTELRYARAQKRLSGGSTPRSPLADDLASGMPHPHGSHTSSLESLLGNGSLARSLIGKSRPTSHTNSRYSSPKGTPQPPKSSSTAAASSSHHFAFHPTISTQPPPGQIPIEPFAQHTPRMTSRKATTNTRARLQGHQPPTSDGQPPPSSDKLPSRRLTPIDMFAMTHVKDETCNNASVMSNTESASASASHSTLTSPTANAHPTYPSYHIHPYSPPVHPTPSSTSSHTHAHPSHHSHTPAYLLHPSTHSPAHPSPSPSSSSPPSLHSPDQIRPLPVQHTVTHSKHGVTEYVLSFRNGEELPFTSPTHAGMPLTIDANGMPVMGDESGEYSLDGPSPRALALEQWRQQHLASSTMAVADAHAATKKDKRAKKKDRHGDTLDDHHHHHHHSSHDHARDDSPLKKKKKSKGDKKLCKVSGCGEGRLFDQKYCKAHVGPAPINPNARKMMFQH